MASSGETAAAGISGGGSGQYRQRGDPRAFLYRRPGREAAIAALIARQPAARAVRSRPGLRQPFKRQQRVRGGLGPGRAAPVSPPAIRVLLGQQPGATGREVRFLTVAVRIRYQAARVSERTRHYLALYQSRQAYTT